MTAGYDNMFDQLKDHDGRLVQLLLRGGQTLSGTVGTVSSTSTTVEMQPGITATVRNEAVDAILPREPAPAPRAVRIR